MERGVLFAWSLRRASSVLSDLMERPCNCSMVVVMKGAGFAGIFLFKFARMATVNNVIPLGHLVFVAFIYGANGLCSHITTTIEQIQTYCHTNTRTHGHTHTHTFTHYLCL